MRAGTLRHRITVERETEVIDPATGYRSKEWAVYLSAVPAAWLPGPGREYLAGEALRSEVQGRFELRWSAEASAIQSSDRVLWDGKVYDVKSDPLTDPTARRGITLMVGAGVNNG